jgi:hypothetical protein
MCTIKPLLRPIGAALFITLTALLFAGCSTSQKPSACCAAPAVTSTNPPVAAAVAAPVVEQPQTPAPVAAKPIRIRAGVSAAFTDSSGNAWLPDQGFADGETVERSDVAIQNTKDAGLYQTERYGMTSFTWPLPNGKYTVKLHFAETYEGITQAGERVFTFNVQGREFKDFDVFAKAGGGLRAYVEPVPVEITDGKLLITFTPQVENPEINGIEIIPGW